MDHEPEAKRAAATRVDPGHLDPAPPLLQGEELPLVCWLRGDEPHAGEFTLDAEAVMSQLGIRRTRLTQISGKELRVGRTRRGRYIVPVYRQEDVDQYLRWTRATASHLKSSSIVQEAALSLKQQGEELAERVSHIAEDLTEALGQTVRQGAFQSARLLDERLGGLSGELAQLRALHDHEVERRRRLAEAHRREVEALRQLVERQAAALAVMARDLAELAGLARVEREDRRAAHQEVMGGLALLDRPAPRPKPCRGPADGRRVKGLATGQKPSPRNEAQGCLKPRRRVRRGKGRGTGL